MSLNDETIGYQFKPYFAIFLCFFPPFFVLLVNATHTSSHETRKETNRLFASNIIVDCSSTSITCNRHHHYRWYRTECAYVSLTTHSHTPTGTQYFSPFRIYQFFFKLIALVFLNNRGLVIFRGTRRLFHKNRNHRYFPIHLIFVFVLNPL